MALPLVHIPKVYLLDIEGTTSSVRFVYDVLFPYARQHFPTFLAKNRHHPDVQLALAQMTGQQHPPLEVALTEAMKLMDADAKQIGLKTLQGMIWKSGYESGELISHVYDDTPPAIRRFKGRGALVCIYSSGSVSAQRQFFAHTIAGSLSSSIDGYFDTTIGGKRHATSYTAISKNLSVTPSDITFYSDIPEELDAAALAGVATVLVQRPGATPIISPHRIVPSFENE